MSINLTLITQMVVFGLLIWFTMTFVWPIILRAMDERAKRIAAGLAAGEQGQKELAQAQSKADEIIREARARALQIIDHGQHSANDVIEQARNTAIAEGERLIAAAQQQTQLDTNRARATLRKEVATLAVRGAAQLLEREVDPKAHAELLDKLAARI